MKLKGGFVTKNTTSEGRGIISNQTRFKQTKTTQNTPIRANGKHTRWWWWALYDPMTQSWLPNHQQWVKSNSWERVKRRHPISAHECSMTWRWIIKFSSSFDFRGEIEKQKRGKSNQNDKQKKTQSKFTIPKLCNTKYKACKLRNPSVILGRLRRIVDSICGASGTTQQWLVYDSFTLA